MSHDPDVTPVGFAATDAPDAAVRRKRGWVGLLAGLDLIVLGLGGIGWFVYAQLDNAPSGDQAVATGRVAALDGPDTPVVRFAAGGGDFTVWLRTDGISLANNRERVVAATNCAATVGDGSVRRFRGAIQGSSVTVGDRSTVGTFSAPEGRVALRCRMFPFGRRRGRDVLRAERAFFVAPGSPSVGWEPWIGLFGGILLIVLAVPVLGRWAAGRLVRRR